MPSAFPRAVVLCLASSLGSGLVAGLQSEVATAAPAEVVFVRRGTLIRQPVLEDGKAVSITQLEPKLIAADRLAVSPDGRTLVVSAGAVHRWLDLGAGTDKHAGPRALICADAVVLSNTAIACATATGYTAIIDVRRHTRRVINASPVGARVVGGALIHAGSTYLWKLDLASGQRTQLSDHQPDAHLLVAPDGSRAVGVYGAGKSRSLESFRLDGRAIRRKLLRNAEPVMWSADSRWLLVQMGKRACIARAVGGQYKCWKRYRAAGLAPDGSWALLSRPGDHGKLDLFRAELAGATTSRPIRIAKGVAAAAVWLSR